MIRLLKWFVALNGISFIASLPPARGADIDKWLGQVAESSVALAATRADIAAELARAGLAGAAYRPDFSIGVTLRQWQDSSLPRPALKPQSRPGAQLTWRVFDWGATSAKVRAEEFSIRSGVERVRRRIVDMLGEAAQTYIIAWAAQAKIVAFQEALVCADSAKDIYTERRRNQIATEAQMRSVASELGLVQTDIADASAELAKAKAQLTRWVAQPKIASGHLTIRPAIVGMMSPEVVIAEAEADRWWAEAEAARAGRLPTLDAVGSIDHRTGDVYSDIMLGARVKIDIFDQAGNSERLRHALAEMNAAMMRSHSASQFQKVKSEVATQIGIAARHSIRSANETIALERLRLEDTRQAFIAGRGDAMPIAQACRRLALGRKQEIETQARLASSAIQQRVDLGDIP